MERPLSPPPPTTLHPTTLAGPLWSVSRLVPLWRHAVWLAAMFAVTLAAVAIRLDVQQLHKDLDRASRRQAEAGVLNERLHLELDSRRRVVALEALATDLSASDRARVVRP